MLRQRQTITGLFGYVAMVLIGELRWIEEKETERKRETKRLSLSVFLSLTIWVEASTRKSNFWVEDLVLIEQFGNQVLQI